MRKLISTLALIFAATACFAGVTVSAPASGATVGSPTHFVASATGSTTISSMIVYVDGNQDYLVYSNQVDTYINLGAGGHTAVIKAWDNWGGVYSQTVNFTVGSSSSSTSTSSGGAGVTISSPANGATVGSPVNFVASAKSSSGSPIASMILYVDGNQKYLTYSANLNTNVSLAGGTHSVTISAWDNNGQIYTSKETITVGSTSTSSSSGSTSTSSGGGVTVNGITVTSPLPNSNVSSPVQFNATASGSGSSIASMMLYIDGNDNKLVYSNSLSTSVSLGSGSHNAVIKAWDNAGKVYSQSFSFTVGSGSTSSTSSSSSGSTTTTASGAVTYSQIQSMGGWGDCTVCAGDGGNGPVAGYSMQQHQGSPSLSGDATKFSIWGSTPYSDVLWWKQLVDGDYYYSKVQAAHHFVYDLYFYIDNPSASQALEFDINQFVNGHSLIFGTQCNIRSGGVWDIWDNQNSHWIHTSKSCSAPSAYTWHHVVIEVERSGDGGDWLHYVSISMDGNKTYIDAWYPPASTSWKGITVNFQMDGNYAMQPYNVWVDKFTLTTW